MFRVMRIHVCYFASIRERLAKAEEILEVADGASVAEIWALARGQADGRVLVAVNHEYVTFAHGLKEGDEVAFFPPVTGG